MKSMRSLYKKLFHYVPDKRIWAYFSMALSAAAVCSYMGAYWFLWQSIVSILVIPVYEKAMYDAIIVVILMILRGILNIASATCSHYLGFRLETNLRKNGLHKLLDASSSFFDHNSSGEIRKIIDDNAAETHKTVAHLIPDNVTAVMTPVLMFVLMFAIDYRLGILLILTTVIGVLQYRKMSGGRGCEAVPHELIHLQYTCFDPFLQTGAFTQAARMLAVIVLAVFARHIFGRVMKWAAVYSTASGFLTGLRHHQLLQRLQRRVSHEIVRHKRTPL